MGTLPLALPYDCFGLPAFRQATLDLWVIPCGQAVKGRGCNAVTAAGFVCFRPAGRIPSSPAPEAPSSTDRGNLFSSEHRSKSHFMDKTCFQV